LCPLRILFWAEDITKGYRRANMVEIVLRPVKTIPGMGGGRIKENDGGGEFNYDML
jgi:hypothetical protein